MQTTEEPHEKTASLVSKQSSSPTEQSASGELPSAIPELLEEPWLQPGESMNDGTEYMDDEEAIQSQLAREEREATSSQVEATPPEHQPVAQGSQDIVEQAREGLVREESVELGEPEIGRFERLMGLLQDGLDMLRTAEFTKEETYQVEDMFMDMKHELYQAEKRGRK